MRFAMGLCHAKRSKAEAIDISIVLQGQSLLMQDAAISQTCVCCFIGIFCCVLDFWLWWKFAGVSHYLFTGFNTLHIYCAHWWPGSYQCVDIEQDGVWNEIRSGDGLHNRLRNGKLTFEHGEHVSNLQFLCACGHDFSQTCVRCFILLCCILDLWSRWKFAMVTHYYWLDSEYFLSLVSIAYQRYQCADGEQDKFQNDTRSGDATHRNLRNRNQTFEHGRRFFHFPVSVCTVLVSITLARMHNLEDAYVGLLGCVLNLRSWCKSAVLRRYH